MTTQKNMSDLKILVVEDQDDVRKMIKDMLENMGVAKVFEAKDGQQAFEFIDAAFDFVDLIICDWNMPELTGVELLRQIRATDEKVPFLMVTGRMDMDSVVEAKNSGVTAYIAKPFSAVQLEAKIRVVLKGLQSS